MMLYVWRFSDAQLAWYPAGLAVAVFGAFAAVGHAHRRVGKRDTAIGAALISGAIAFLPYAARHLGWWPELGGWPSMIQIGRASGRESVCEYVCISVVAE